MIDDFKLKQDTAELYERLKQGGLLPNLEQFIKYLQFKAMKNCITKNKSQVERDILSGGYDQLNSFLPLMERLRDEALGDPEDKDEQPPEE